MFLNKQVQKGQVTSRAHFRMYLQEKSTNYSYWLNGQAKTVRYVSTQLMIESRSQATNHKSLSWQKITYVVKGLQVQAKKTHGILYEE